MIIFLKLVMKLVKNVPSIVVNYSDFLPNQHPYTMFIDPVVPCDITNTAHKLKSKSSFGHDEISTKLLKQTINNITLPITHIVVLCDLSKAFDVINHKILLHKLKTYGIRGLANDWFSSYLSNTTQFVEIDGQNSSKKQIMWSSSRVNFGALVILAICQ